MGKDIFQTRICPECGKEFIYNSLSIYKIIKNGVTYRYCSYACYNKYKIEQLSHRGTYVRSEVINK